ncbi:hypothetical protein F5878DRAFT_667950 [Lentinula raphanica]|uniref:Uncharacterized protein n=1 Tax=Lentinula raphanica TaxID=153919 RepID=A0AA38NUY0_9AGAR|nr:hypothetical protein F5878DRAFT_667950 [Lentinula raphanica]
MPMSSSTTVANAGSSMNMSMLTPHTLMKLDHQVTNIPGETMLTTHIIDKRENPPTEIAVDILVDNKFISYEDCTIPQMFKVQASEIVRALENKSIIQGLIKLSTPHHRIPTAQQPFLISQLDLPLLETPLSLEYLTARDSIVSVTIEYALSPHQIDNIIDRMKQKREERKEFESHMQDLELVRQASSRTAIEASKSTITSDDEVPIHVARVRTNIRKATGSSRISNDDKSKALVWLTEQVVAKDGYALFNRFRGSDKAQNPDIVKMWLFISDLASEYLHKPMHIPNITSEIKITKKMLFESLAIHETTMNTILRAASLVHKYGEHGSHASLDVIARLTKVVPIDRANGSMPEG